MEDTNYADKYARGAKKTEPLKKIKQASDARFLNGIDGTYMSAGMAYRSNVGGAGIVELGMEHYLTSYLTNRASLTATAGWDQLSLGLDGGVRLQTPTRLAPFAGAGGFIGTNWETVDARDDGKDNDGDGSIDERGEEDTEWDLTLVAVYPELGAHFWWTPRVRLTGFGRYMITSDGRASDTWLLGGGLAIFKR